MAWEGSNRRGRLPANWPEICRDVLFDALGRRRRCEWRYPNGGRCRADATDVDHIEAGDNHDRSNLQPLCEQHHRIKSSREGHAAKAAKRAAASRKFRRVEQHPGRLGLKTGG